MSDRGRRGRTKKKTHITDATRTNTHRLYGSCIRKYIHLQTIQKIFPKPENRGEGNEDSMRGVEKKSIATSDTRFVENIQKNGIRVEINDTYRMYKQYVLFSDAKTPSRRDFSLFFLHWPNPPFRGHCFYRHDDVADWFLRSRDTRRRASERTTSEEVRALYDAVSFFLFLCFVFSSRCARRARRPRVSYASGEHREKRARGSAAGDPGTSFFARNRDGVDDATGRTTRRGSRTITGGDFLPNVSSSASLASSSSSSSRTRTEDTPGVGGRVPLDSSSGGAPRAVAQTVVPTVPLVSGSNRPTDRWTDDRARVPTDGRSTDGRK